MSCHNYCVTMLADFCLCSCENKILKRLLKEGERKLVGRLTFHTDALIVFNGMHF